MSQHERPEITDYKEDTDISRVHSAVLREKLNISTSRESPPAWVYVVCALILIGGGTYLGAYSAGFKSDVSDPYMAVHTVDTRQNQSDTVAVVEDIGKATYANCQSCHQLTGKGSGDFPPLAGSEWVTGGTKRLALIILKGLNGQIVVSGKTYSKAEMLPGGGAQLTDKQVAAVMTYIRNSWGNEGSEVTEKMVANAREEFKDITTKANAALLEAIPADEDLVE